MIKNMVNTTLGDLITFLYLFPDADVICCGDKGVVNVPCEVDSVVRGQRFKRGKQ